MALTKEQKDQIIADLIANEGLDFDGPWNENDRKALEAIPEEKLVALNKQRELLVNALEDDEDDEDDDEEPIENKKSKKETVSNQQQTPTEPQKEKTVDEWLATAPGPIRSAVNNALAFEKQQKDALVQAITANESSPYTAKELESWEIPALRKLSQAMSLNVKKEEPVYEPMAVPHFSGILGASPQSPTNNNFRNEDLDIAPEPFDWSSAE